MTPDALRDRIRDTALALGFDAFGVTQARLGQEARARLADFLAAGHHGEMGWLAQRTDQRGDPRALWPDARSVIAVGLSYAPGEDPRHIQQQRDRGGISVYARNRDYHDVMKGMLKHLAQAVVKLGKTSGVAGAPEVKVFVDTAPVMEKPLAALAQLGWQGKHTNLVSRDHGSWLRQLYGVPGGLPDRRLPGALPARCHPLHLLPDDRACRPDPGRVPQADGQPDLRLRRLPRGLSLEPVRIAGTARQAAGARRPGRTGARRTRRPRRCRLPDAVFRLADQAHRPRPVRAQRRHRDRQFRRPIPGAGGGQALGRPRPGARRGRRLGLRATVAAALMRAMVKRSLALSGHRTSVALEPEFWAALDRIAAGRGQSLIALVESVDSRRDPARGLASALRVLALLESTPVKIDATPAPFTGR
jgi:predicted DNA-binding ribbon-helix-helix protein